ncbi:MAG TPA: arginine deiminase family protein, partial [Roseiflexaceae bacterium]|nr:arginine deiminase family protein [Roseiflexaceae bacterium]
WETWQVRQSRPATVRCWYLKMLSSGRGCCHDAAVPVAPGVVVMPAGNPNTERALARHGVECHPVDVSELTKGGGAVHCMTGVILRDTP